MLFALFGVLFLVQLFLVLLVSVQAGVSLLHARSDVRLQIDADATEESIQEFYVAVRALPEIVDVRYVNREQAYEQEKVRDPGLVAFLEKYGLENPFPNTFAVTLASLDGYGQLASLVALPQWAGVVEPSSLTAATAQHTQLLQLLTFLDAVSIVAVVFLVIAALTLLAVGTALVHHRVYQRADAITLQCLLGAKPFDVFFPFVWETTVLVLLAVALSGGSIAVLLILLPELLPGVTGDPLFSAFFDEGALLFRTALPTFWIVELLLSPLLAAACVMLGVQWKPPSPLKVRR